MKVLILGSNLSLYCGWTTMTLGISEGLSQNNVQNLILEGINPSKRFNNPLHLSSHIRDNFMNLVLDFFRIMLITLFYKPKHIILVPEFFCRPVFISHCIFFAKIFY